MNKYLYIFILSVLFCRAEAQTTYYPGNFAGTFDVGPIGNATYTIPLDLPVGTAGFQPELAIVYNSQGGDGILGRGFSLSGLSSISRRPGTFLHDGLVIPIDFTSSDRYIWDGNILSQKDATSSYIEYRTELYTGTRIKKHNPGAYYGHFEVNTKDGLTYEYGNTTDSRLVTTGGLTALWMINKVSDRLGNNYTYTYEKAEATGEIRIKQIEYNVKGTTASTRYFVKFTYKNRTYPVNLNYIAGYKFQESKLLDCIEIYYGTTRVRKYVMEYDLNNTHSTNVLTAVLPYGENDNTIMKRIRFDWYMAANHNLTNIIPNSYVSPQYNVDKANITLGDFNGDGRTDVLLTPRPEANWTGWRLFLAREDGDDFVSAGTGTLIDGFEYAIAGDFNGDGITDFIARKKSTSKSSAFTPDAEMIFDDNLDLGDSPMAFMETNDSIDVEDNTNESEDEDGNIIKAAASISSYFVYYGTGSGFTLATGSIFSASREHEVKVADINGDGAHDFFVYYKTKSGTLPDYVVIQSTCTAGGVMTALSTQYSGRLPASNNWGSRVELYDFSGSGMADILNIHDTGSDYFRRNNETLERLPIYTGHDKNYRTYFGDFNGDGKIDMLVTGTYSGDWSQWQMRLSTGNGFESFQFPQKFNTRDKEIIVCDLNGDGMDDFFAVPRVSTQSQPDPLTSYISYNCGRDFKSFSSGVRTYGLDLWYFYPINSRGDGKMGFFTTSVNSAWIGRQLYMPSKDYSKLLKTITDSYGNVTTVTYKNMSDNTVYTKTNPTGGSATVSGYDCLSFTAPFKLVSNVNMPNGIGGTRNYTYKYENGKLSKRGRGFLGYTKIISTDVAASIQNTLTQEFSPGKYIAAVKKTESRYVSGSSKLLSETNYTNTLNSLSSNVFYVPTSIVEKKYEPSNESDAIESKTTTNTYDSYGNITKQIIKSDNYYTETITNTYTNNTTDWLLGLLTRRERTVDSNNTVTNCTDYAYDSNGLLKEEIREPTNSDFYMKTEYTYDVYGNVTRIKRTADNVSRTESFTYITNGRFLSKYTDALGNNTEYTYFPATGLVKTKKDIDGVTTTYAYDTFGQLTAAVENSALLNFVTITREFLTSPSNASIRITETYGDGQKIKTIYDKQGREIETEHKNFAGDSAKVSTAYNALGKLYTVSDPYFSSTSNKTTYTYDEYGRITKQATPIGNITYSYNGASTTITDGTKNGITKVQTTDLTGRIKTVSETGGETVTYTYGPSGKPKEIEVGSVIFTMDYDILGRQTALVDPNAGTLTYAYNAWGDLTEKKDARNAKEVYTYKSNGRVNTYSRGKQNPLSSTWVNDVFTYEYHSTKKHLVTKAASGNIETSYAYDTYGRVTSKTEKVDGENNNVKAFTFNYAYNSFGQLSMMTYPGEVGSEGKLEYVYANGELKQLKWKEGNATATSIWEKKEANAKGQPLKVTLGNGSEEIITYHKSGMPLTINAKKGSSVITNLKYTVSSQGNITKREDLRKSALKEDFLYDNLNRLKTGVTYNSKGNILSKTNVGTFSYNGTAPHAITDVSNMGTNILSQSAAIMYNSVNMPTSILALTGGDPNIGGSMTFTYNSGNRRIKTRSVNLENSTSDIQAKYFVGPYEEIEINGTTTQKNHYIYAEGKLVAVKNHVGSTKNTYYFYTDHLGSPIAIANNSGTVVQRQSFDAWGRRRDPESWTSYTRNLPPLRFDRGFTGHEHIEMFDLINMNARLYDPVLGRFLSPDPYVADGQSSQAFNRYTYANNNPLVYTDPDGELAWLIPLIVGGVMNWIAHGAEFSWEGLAYFGVGAVAAGGGLVGGTFGALAMGPGGALVGAGMGAGFVLGSGNYTVSQGFNSWGSFSWEQFYMSGLKSAAIGAAGGYMSGTLAPYISKILPKFGNVIVDKIVSHSTVGATTGFSLSTGAALMDGASFEEALEFGKDGLWTGFTTGVISGTIAGGKATYEAAKIKKEYAIQFGKTENQVHHTFRHTDALGLDRALVESTIQNHLKTVSSQIIPGQPFNRIIEISGQRIQYTAYKLPNGTVNIGRIHGIK